MGQPHALSPAQALLGPVMSCSLLLRPPDHGLGKLLLRRGCEEGLSTGPGGWFGIPGRGTYEKQPMMHHKWYSKSTFLSLPLPLSKINEQKECLTTHQHSHKDRTQGKQAVPRSLPGSRWRDSVLRAQRQRGDASRQDAKELSPWEALCSRATLVSHPLQL